MPLKLSIVIATYNRGPGLIRTLESLAAQTASPKLWEAVVVNNNSVDDTEGMFREFSQKNPDCEMRMVRETSQGLSYARNRGISESRGEYIAIIDDDELVNPEFAESYISFFDSHPEVAAAGGKISPLYESVPPKWLSPIAERPIAGTLDLGDRAVPFRGERYPGGGNMAIRRAAVDKYGMFNPELGRTGTKLLAGEEKDLFRRLSSAGERIWYVPGARIRHIITPPRLTKDYFVRLSRMIGVSERVRTLGISQKTYRKRLFAEAVKWVGTLALAFWYLVRITPAKGWYLILLRYNISRGLLSASGK